MKFLKYILAGVTAVALAATFSACGGDEDDPEDPGNPGGGEEVEDPSVKPEDPVSGWDTPLPSGPALSDADAKNYLEQTANLVADCFKPEDQRPLVDLADAFIRDYGNYEFNEYDDEYDDDEYSRKTSSRGVRSFFEAIRRAIASGDYMALSRSAFSVVTFENFTGVYVPDTRNEVFVRDSDSDKFVIIFYKDGTKCELQVSQEGATWSLDVSDFSDGEVSTVKVPRKLHFNLTEGSTSRMHGTLETFWRDGSSMIVNADLTVANIRGVAKFSSSNTDAKLQEWLYISGDLIQTSTASVKGSGLVTLSALKGLMKEEVETWSDGYNTYYESWYEWDEDAVARMFHSGNCTCNLLNRVLATAEVPTSASFEDLGEGYYYSDDYDGNRTAARQACQNWCDKVNRGVITDLCLGSTTPSASLTWQPAFHEYVSEYYTYWYFEPEPVIAFSDGTTYGIEEYGKTNFTSFKTRLSSLVNAYKAMFNAVH